MAQQRVEKVTHESVVVEKLFAQRGLVGVYVGLRNAEVTGVTLTWYVESANSSGWAERNLPGGMEWLEDLHAAIGDVLDQVEYRKDRKDFLYRVGAAKDEGEVG